MATSNLETKLVVTDPDFENIKTNLKNFLRSQDTFIDYDFEGSGLSALIDLLAYNTHYMAFYANMIANESFLDTASMRDSVVSHAKMLGYVPRSVKSAVARINLTFADTSTSTTLTLPKFTKFSSSALDGVNYIFTNLEEKTVYKDTINNEFKFTNLNLTEGTSVNYVYTYNSVTNPQAEFLIPDPGADISTLEIIVQNSSSDLSNKTYQLASDATIVDQDSLVYFVEENKDQKHKIYFGNGIVGKALTDGNIVIMSYLLSKGEAANKANTFTLLDVVKNSTGDTITANIKMIQAAAGGAAAESIENIKFAAPKAYVSNNRAVTKSDYISMILKNYPSLEAVNVWGGEENIPPVYGKVFVSAKPALGYEITATERQYIIDEVISPYSVVTVTPEFVNPDYSYLNMDIAVTYDPTATARTAGEIETIVRSAVYNFANTNLDRFNSTFKVSRLMREIDNVDPSILGNQLTVKIQKKLEPILEYSRNYKINFNTPLKRSTGKNRIVSYPAYKSYDLEDNYRSFYFEETPLAFTGLYSVNVIYGGLRGTFEYAPTLKVFGDGFGAEAEAVITNGAVTSVNVLKSGTEYSSITIIAYDQDGNELPNLIFEGVIESEIGALRSYYFDDNKVKQIYSTSAGIINYSTGEITINNFTPIDIENDIKVLSFYAEPLDPVFSSERNSIVTLDLENTAALKITTIQAK